MHVLEFKLYTNTGSFIVCMHVYMWSFIVHFLRLQFNVPET